MRFLAHDVTQAARAHAIREWPRESCGGVTADGYIEFANVAANPVAHFDCGAEIERYGVALRALALTLAARSPALPKITPACT